MLGAIAALFGVELKSMARRGAWIAALGLLTAVCVLAAAGYGVSAIRTVLIARYDAVSADLIIAGAFLAVAIVFVIAIMIMRRQPKPAPTTADAAAIAVPLLASVVTSKTSNVVKAAPLVLVAAYFLGKKYLGRR